MSLITQSHEDLQVWKKSMDLVEYIYGITKNFPKEELFGLTSQMRRAVTAIPTNITEGYHRNYPKEYIQFLYISKSSACELSTLLQISERLKLIDSSKTQEIKDLLTEVLKMLSVMISKLKEKYRVTA